jgi:hypothetical protein
MCYWNRVHFNRMRTALPHDTPVVTVPAHVLLCAVLRCLPYSWWQGFVGVMQLCAELVSQWQQLLGGTVWQLE